LASTGYRPGGAGAPRTALSLPQTVYGKETVKSYEIGTKNRFVHDRLQVNGAIYYNDYPAFQNLLNYNNGGGVAAAVVGVPARIYGTELELKAVVTADDLIDASASYINARYTADAIATNPFTGAPDPLSTKGQALPHAPKLQFNLDYNHSFWFTNDSKVVWDVTAHYQDKQAVAFSNCLYSGSDSSIACQTAVPATDPATIAKYVQRSYTLFDSSISFSSKGDRFTATLYGRNLTDRVIKTSVLESTVLATYAPPRTVGLVLTGRF
jgi:iron complex outermembrane receptor protein